MKQLARKLANLFQSRVFLYVVIGLFVFEALWFVFSAIYPMAFDENVHFGIIQIYSKQWSPFLNEQPPGADIYGAITRDPSFLYHYLMSFPYRLISLFMSSETLQVIGLRLINVGMFTVGLWLYAKTMLRAHCSRALVHVSLAVFVLIPVAPHLAAHINYDNLLMLLLPLLALKAFDLIDGFKKRRIDVRALLICIVLCLALSLVKYAALPFVVAAVIFLTVMLVYYFRGKYDEIWPAAKKGWSRVSRVSLVVLCGLTIAGSGLFVQRYGLNLVRYKTPVPSCDQVLTVKQCSQYGPWNRDRGYEQQRSPGFKASPVTFMGAWLKGMRHRLFFAVNGAKSYYNNYPGLPVPSKTALALGIVGLILVVFWRSRLFVDNPYLGFLTAITVFYIVVLWLEEFEAYARTGKAVAINGRYLLPVLLFVAAFMGRAFSLTLHKHPQAKTMLAAVVLMLFLYGGGISTFILRSDQSWYWPNDMVIRANNAVRRVLAPIIIEGNK